MFIFLISLVAAEPLSQKERSLLLDTCGKRLAVTTNRAQRSMYTPEAKRIEAPWTVALKYTPKWNPEMKLDSQFNKSRVICSGTLISSRHVLTAAHCFGQVIEPVCQINNTLEVLQYSMNRRNLDRFLVVAPDVCLQDNCSSQFDPKGIKINKVFFSSQYVLSQCFDRIYNIFQGDVAVIELQTDVPFTSAVQPACLSDEPILPGTHFSMFGYGVSLETTAGILRKHETVTKEECAGEDVKHENLICSSHPHGAGCGGDSGSSQIVFDHNGTAFVSSVYVAGKSCAAIVDIRSMGIHIEAEDVSVALSAHSSWICEVSGICTPHAKGSSTVQWQSLQARFPLLAEIASKEPVTFLTLEKLTGDDVYV